MIYEKNGKFYSKIKIKGNQKHFLCHGAKNKLQAQAIEDAEKYKLRQQIAGLIEPTKKKVSLNTLLKLYQNYSKLNKRSYETYDKFVIELIRNFFGGGTIVNDLKISDFENFKVHLVDSGRKPSTINKHIQTIGKMFNLGIDEGLIEYNPITKIKKLRVDNYKIRYLTKEETSLFKEITKGYEVIGRDRKKKTLYPYIHLKPVVICALQTGMRKSEILNCRKDWIDFNSGFIHVLETKNGKAREIPISPILKTVFEESIKNNDSAYVFINKETGEPYIDIKRSFNTVLEKAKIDEFSFHCLRHTAATRMIEKGVDIVVVKEILGHSDIATTMRYTHSDSKRKQEAIKILSNYNDYELI